MATRTMKATAAASMSALALAALSTTAQADDGPNFYGTFDVGIESFSGPSGTDRAGGIFPGLGTSRGFSGEDTTRDPADQDASMINGFKTNVGVQGSEDLGDGLSANYQLELGLEILDGGNPGTEMRLGWAGLAGNWGEVRVGTQWTALFDYVAWNTNRNDIHTGSAYFNAMGVLGFGGFNDDVGSLNDGFRQDSAVSYMYGSPYDYSNPFTAQVQLGIGEGDENESAVSSVQVAGQYAIDERFIINAVYAQDIVDAIDNAENDREPYVAALGGRAVVSDALELGANVIYSDTDDSDLGDLTTFIVGAFYDFVGTGFSTDWSVGTSDGDFNEMDYNVTGTVRYSFSDRTNVRLEGERVEYSDDDANPSETVGLVGLQHSF